MESKFIDFLKEQPLSVKHTTDHDTYDMAWRDIWTIIWQFTDNRKVVVRLATGFYDTFVQLDYIAIRKKVFYNIFNSEEKIAIGDLPNEVKNEIFKIAHSHIVEKPKKSLDDYV